MGFLFKKGDYLKPVDSIASSKEPQTNGAGENSSKDFLEVEGEVVELLPAATFRVRIASGHQILCHLAGRMRMHRIRLLPGDRVKVQMTPYDLTKGRITYRY